jgi:hypothetical protein
MLASAGLGIFGNQPSRRRTLFIACAPVEPCEEEKTRTCKQLLNLNPINLQFAAQPLILEAERVERRVNAFDL